MYITLNASGSTSAITIQIMHPAANPVQKGKNLLNASAHINEGTATIGCINILHKNKKPSSETAITCLNKILAME